MSTKSPTMVRSSNKPADTDVDRYIRESCRSFKECNIKNNARRNSLQKKTLGIESERRLASSNMSREERQLREHLRHMNIEKAKNNIVYNLRETKSKKKSKPAHVTNEHVIPIEPYPVTFRTQTPFPQSLDKQLEHNGYTRKRRESREFEDININTMSSSFTHIIGEEPEQDETQRRRVHSLSLSQNPRFRKELTVLGNPTAPRFSPNLRRKVLSSNPPLKSKGKAGNSSSSSKESLTDSCERLSSFDELRWVGAPEAIHSVRRSRKTVEEQEIDNEIHKLKIT